MKKIVHPRTGALVRVAAALAFIVALPVAASATHETDTDRLYAVQSRLSTPNFQLFLNIAQDTTVSSSGPLFTLDGAYGSAFLGNDFLVSELDNQTLSDYYLATVPHEGAFRGQGSRVSATPVGFPNIEGLAVADGTIYGASINFGAHETTLITIDRTTGVGSSIGMGPRNVLLVGLAFDPTSANMYGAAIPFGGGEPSAVDEHTLYMVDMETGDAVAIGPFGTVIQSLAWDAELGLVGSFEKLYTIDETTGTATELGPTDFTDGRPGTLNGIYALGSVFATLCGDGNGDGKLATTDALIVLKAGVGARGCSLMVCDANSSCRTSTTDALLVLKSAVGGGPPLVCPANPAVLCAP